MKYGCLAAVCAAALWAHAPVDPAAQAAARGLRWLAATQGADGGWGQDGGAATSVRRGEKLETQGNDVANTAVAALALMKSKDPAFRPHIQRAVEFVLRSVEARAGNGLAVTTVTGSQIQRKLGPFIDTFLAAQLLGEIDGPSAGTAAQRERVRRALEKCVRKIEANQLQDGSWNLAGGWAPILGTSMASRSLRTAQEKGVRVDGEKLAKVRTYSAQTGGVVGGIIGGVASAPPPPPPPAAAGVALYSRAQQLEELSRTEADRKANAPALRQLARDLQSESTLRGFGSMGGEEFFSYLNIADSMRRTGGPEWVKWNRAMKTRLVSLQNQDGTWAGHHCITGRVAVTSAAILTMLVERDR